jgi:IstB-like ATP binding protein
MPRDASWCSVDRNTPGSRAADPFRDAEVAGSNPAHPTRSEAYLTPAQKRFCHRFRQAMLDRLLHRSVVFNITGESYRMRTHRAHADKLRRAAT